MRRSLFRVAAAAPVLALALAITGCSSMLPPNLVAPDSTSAAPSPEQAFLQQVHADEVPGTDDQILQSARQYCQALSGGGTATDNEHQLARDRLVLSSPGWKDSDADHVIYAVTHTLCPQAIGQ